MNKSSILGMVLSLIPLILLGCGDAKKLVTSNGQKGPLDTDVSSSPEYNFSSFAGTVWETKVKVALAYVESYSGERALNIFTPQAFDPTCPGYTPVPGMQTISVLPVGTRIRILRLMKDNGNWGGFRVTAKLENGSHSEETIYLTSRFLAKNRFIWGGWSSATTWDVDPEILQKATDSRSAP
jgi:hypothetical protein